jgi:hypothetical protein
MNDQPMLIESINENVMFQVLYTCMDRRMDDSIFLSPSLRAISSYHYRILAKYSHRHISYGQTLCLSYEPVSGWTSLAQDRSLRR